MEVDTVNIRKKFKPVAEERILDGEFTKEFTTLDKDGPGIQKKLKELYEKTNQSDLAKREARVRERLGLKTT